MIKSVHSMTASEIKEARESGAPVYGTTMAKRDLHGRVIYSDIEEFNPHALLVTISELRYKGWSEEIPNRYTKLGMHPRKAASMADSTLTRMAFGK